MTNRRKHESSKDKIESDYSYRVFVAVATACAVIRAKAQDTIPPPDPERMLFGMAGITRTQTARINVVNIGLQPPSDPELPSDPCRVVLAFVDSDGNVLRNGDGQPVRRVVTLARGHAAFLQINGSDFIGRDEVRVNFRPVVKVLTPPPDPERAIVPTLEVIENASSKTTWVLGWFNHNETLLRDATAW
jgi:hypothetical protein